MGQHKTIPDGYCTVGQAAKKMSVSVRTLQYYDKEGLLPPSALSEGGRRLYSDKDILKLHQILSLKHLGFSLDDIKNRLIPLDTPAEVATVLDEQITAVREKIAALSESVRELEALREEVLQMQTVNFRRYADIIVNLQLKNDFYWLIKHFDEPMLDHIRQRFDQESAANFTRRFLALQEEAIQLQAAGVPADGARGLAFAKAYWELITEFTGGDFSILSRLIALGQSDHLEGSWQEKQEQANRFIEPALNAWFAQSGLNPFQEEPT